MSNSTSDAGGPRTVFYVSRDGDDTWSGRLETPNEGKSDGPLATLSRARDAIQELKAKAGLTAPVDVMVRGGTYVLDAPIAFGPEDGGTAGCPVTYMAYPGEKPVLSGGRRVAGPWRVHSGEIMVCSLPEVKEGKWFFRQLFVNGERQTRARFPREGYYFIESAVDEAAFHYREGDFKRWRNLQDVEAVVFHSWNESRLRVSDLDEGARVVRFIDPDARHPIGWKDGGGPNRYYIENVFEALQRPGDWYLDRHTGELYYWPVGNVEDLEIVAPALTHLLQFKGGLKARHIAHVAVRGLTFAHTDWTLPEKGYPDCGDVGDIVPPSAVTFENACFCAFEDNCVRNVGAYALEVTGHGHRMVGNTLFDAGGGGIISRNYGEARNVIAYNHIHRCGEVYPSAVGINIDDGGGEVSHNLIHDISHSGIYTRHWRTAYQPVQRDNQEQGLIIDYNEIYNVMQKMNDGGGLFVRDAHIVIRNNLIHDVYSFSDRCPGWGIYLGCETRDTVVENNVVYRTREGVHVWYYDRNVRMENNVLVDGEISQIHYQNPKHLRHENIRLLRNILCCSGDTSLLFRMSGERSLPAESDSNCFFHTGGKALRNWGAPGLDSFDEWQGRGLDAHSIVADPLFADPEHDDYSLRPESPAFKLGFKAIDLSTVGLRGRKR